MTNILPPLFTRLYISLLAALFASILSTLYLSEVFLERNENIDFYEDTFHLFIEIRSELRHTKVNPTQYISDLGEQRNQFKVDWQQQWLAARDCVDCQFLTKINGTAIYQVSPDRLLAVYPLEQPKGVLLLSDLHEHNLFVERKSDELLSTLIKAWQNDPASFAPFILLLIVIITIGTTLYFSVRKLQKQINQLVQVNQKFGQGELSIRATDHYSEPVNLLANSFNKMADSITETVKENQIFAQAVPHEMRTPLSRIQLTTGLLRQRKQDAQELLLLDNIDSYIDDIDNLTRQVMTFSKLNAVQAQQEQQKPQSIQLKEYLQSRINHLHSDSNIKVIVEVAEVTLECDSAYLRLMFDNIFSNALRYTDNQVKVTVKQSTTLSSTKLMTLCIDDDGQGIANHDFDAIFLPFYRIDKSRNLATGGLGLGLAIAKAAAMRMNGKLYVSQSHLGGACFSCELNNNS